MTGRIDVLSPRTWGEFGNYLAATRVTGALAGQVDAGVRLAEAEEFVPWLGEVGARIRTLTLDSPDAATRTARYLALMDEVAGRFPVDAEADPKRAGLDLDLDRLVERFDRDGPALVVATKGIVARLCVAAGRLATVAPRVVSYVTNPGLLRLPIHPSRHVDLTLVPFEWARDELVHDHGVSPGRVAVVGPMVAQHDLGRFLATQPSTAAAPAGGWVVDGSSRPKVIVFSNRGGADFSRLIAHLATRHPSIDLVFVGYDDPGLVQTVADRAGVAHWRFHSRLTQEEYFGYIDAAARAEVSFLVSKAGPNTTLEAAYFGIPVLLLESGLPMESWVPGLVAAEGLGRCCASLPDMVAQVDRWLADPPAVAAHKRAAVGFARRVLDQRAVEAAVGAAVGGLLHGSRDDRVPR